MTSFTPTDQRQQHDQATVNAMSMVDKLQSRIDKDMDAHQDPDAQATVTDFLDFTEYLPSDMMRSLRLIGNLDETATKASKNVHELTKVYGELPDRPDPERPNSTKLRADISQNLTEAVNARTLSYEEACRMKENVDRHYNRLKNIHAKLQKMAENLPPSRPASPEPEQSKSPQVTRTVPKVTLRLDGSKGGDRIRRHRKSRITVPGEVMAPFDVEFDSYGSYSETESSHDEEEPTTTQAPALPINKPKSIKLNVVPKASKEKLSKLGRPPRADGSLGTNVHSHVAGISTSNALARLKPPTADAKPGDPDAPWLKLTAWELAKLRKKMKKNAIWNPSDTMIARELKAKGRSLDDYKKHNVEREAAGLAPLDLSPQMMNAAQATKVLQEGEISSEASKEGDLKSYEAKRYQQMVEKEVAPELENIADANKFAAAQRSIVLEHSPSSKSPVVNNSTKDFTGEGNSTKQDPLAKSMTSKSMGGKKILSRAAAKEAKDSKDGSKEDGKSETPTEHTHLLSNLEGLKERMQHVLAQSGGLAASDGRSGTLKTQPARTGNKRRTRDSTADTETSKASKSSRIEGPVTNPSLIGRLAATGTSVPNLPPSSSSTTTIIPLAPPGPASSRLNLRSGTPLTAVSPDNTTASIVPGDVGSKVPVAIESEVNVGHPVEAIQEQEPVGTRDIAKYPRRKVTQKEKRARLKLVKAAKKEAQAQKEAQKEALKEAQKEAEREAEQEAQKQELAATATGSRSRRKASVAPVAPLQDTQSLPSRRTASRPASRSGRAPSHEPQSGSIKERPRRCSTAHTTPAPEPRAHSKRLEAKRPPPGQVTAGPDGSASVSVSQRKAAPRKRAAAPKRQKEEGREAAPEDTVELDDEGNVIDEAEPRYCTCNKVSFGNMIACDSDKILNRDCPFGEWFHYACVGYSEINMPPRRDSWFCEGCLQEIHAAKTPSEKSSTKRK